MPFSFLVYQNILAPTSRFILQTLRWLWPDKLARIVRLKNEDLASRTKFDKPPFWIHASSGEIEYAKPILRELKSKYPRIPILVTYSSVSAQKLISGIPEIDSSCIIPWESQNEFEKFLNFYQPRCLLIARTDVWPVMISAVKKRQIPSLLFSATLTKESSRVRGLSRGLSQFSFNQLNDIFCVSGFDSEVFQSLNLATPVKVVGDSRFEQVIYRMKNPRPLKNEIKPPSTSDILVAGSTWPEDEDVLLKVLSSNPQIRCILAPHEVDEQSISELVKTLNKFAISNLRYSEATEVWKSEQVLIVDEVGHLADLYNWGQVAFVGGSFREKVHSVMEPLAAQKPVIVGPHFNNNREAQQFAEIKFQIKNSLSTSPGPISLVTRVLTARQFADALNVLLSLSESSQSDLAHVLGREVRKRAGSSLEVLAWVQSKVDVSN